MLTIYRHSSRNGARMIQEPNPTQTATKPKTNTTTNVSSSPVDDHTNLRDIDEYIGTNRLMRYVAPLTRWDVLGIVLRLIVSIWSIQYAKFIVYLHTCSRLFSLLSSLSLSLSLCLSIYLSTSLSADTLLSGFLYIYL